MARTTHADADELPSSEGGENEQLDPQEVVQAVREHLPGPSVLTWQHHVQHDTVCVLVVDRRAPTEYANEGEYISAVEVPLDGGDVYVLDGQGTGRAGGYDVTNVVESHDSLGDAVVAAANLHGCGDE